MSTTEIRLPDVGGFKDVPVIEVFVKPGDTLAKEAPMITLESDKATMEVPAPQAGRVAAVRVKIGDTINEGDIILTLETADAAAPSPSGKKNEQSKEDAQPAVKTHNPPAPTQQTAPMPLSADKAPPAAEPPAGGKTSVAHASPSIRKYARELGVDITRVSGSGPKGRIVKEDVKAFIKQALTGSAKSSGATPFAGLLPWPEIDFSKFGETEAVPLSRIKKISGANLSRNWVMIPHVTQFEEADITALEALRVTLNKENGAEGVKITLLAFLFKACVAALQRFPDFNASLQGETLIRKKYYHLGFAADTPNGLVVPVIRDCDRKSVSEIAQETAALAAKARKGSLAPAEMQGGCFTISSLGGIGGTAFTPILNAPEVAILGVSKNRMRPIWDGEAFIPRLMLPLSLSYDHRVIDGALAARFTTYLARILADMRRVLV